MRKVIVRIPTTGKIYSYKTGLSLKPSQEVLVEEEGTVEQALVILKPEIASLLEEGKGQILRKLSEEDRQKIVNLKDIARRYLAEASAKVGRHSLPMRILDADLSFDERKLTFYFSANGRVDFRSLVTDMVKSFNKIIRLQQVGARDEAKFFGGIGKCGRELCCAKFLHNLESITLEMAEIQELSTAGSGKLSGCCGKLMCCLSYETENYHSKNMEKIKKKS